MVMCFVLFYFIDKEDRVIVEVKNIYIIKMNWQSQMKKREKEVGKLLNFKTIRI